MTKIAIIGDSWAALGSLGLLATSENAIDLDITWITGTGARSLPPLPLLEQGLGVTGWRALLSRMGIESAEPQAGHYLREFRHKSFARPTWHKSPTRAMRIQTRDEELWGPEARFAPAYEVRFEQTLGELEERVRERLAARVAASAEKPYVDASAGGVKIRKIEGVPVKGFEESETGPVVVLGSGEKIACDRVIYADKWTALTGMEGLPKAQGFTRSREPVGLLQAVFTHTHALVAQQMQEAFYCVVHKDPGEEFTRAVWGYFMDGGKRSVWTIFTASEESEDNHEIGKKLRRLKQTLERMFVGPEWVPEGKKTFLDTVADEAVRFEENFVFSRGDSLPTATKLPKLAHVAFLSDGFGPSAALAQVVDLLGAELGVQPTEWELGATLADASSASESEGPAPEAEGRGTSS